MQTLSIFDSGSSDLSKFPTLWKSADKEDVETSTSSDMEIDKCDGGI